MTVRVTPRFLYLFAVSYWFISGAWNCAAQSGRFHPLDLTPTLYYSSHLTFKNPWDVSQCTGRDEPIWGCTGSGTGDLPSRIESFVIVDDTSQNRACTGFHSPWRCCNGAYPDPGNTCAYEQPDNARNGLGPSYCPAFRLDGCVNQWIDQTAKKSLTRGHPYSGIPIEQDDLEKPEFILHCTRTEMPCVRGGPKWDEPLYPPAEDPNQDLIMELEPPDRSQFDFETRGGGPYWSVQVVRIVEQPEDHNLFDAAINFTTARAFKIHTPKANTIISINDAIPLAELGSWCIVDVARNALDEISVFLLCENIPLTDVSVTPPAIEPTNQLFPGVQYLCDGKDCGGLHQFNGDTAAWFARAAVDGGDPTPQERADLMQYFYDTFLNSPIIFSDGFESGDTSVWSTQ